MPAIGLTFADSPTARETTRPETRHRHPYNDARWLRWLNIER